MTTTPDAVALLDTLLRDEAPNAFDPDAPAAHASLERILAAPPLTPAPRRPRRPLRRLGLAVTAVAVIVAAIALLPSVGRSPDVVARAAAALNQPDTILHFKAQVRYRVSPGELRARTPDDTIDQTIAVWQTAGARQERAIYDGDNELVEDWDEKTALSYSAEQNLLIRNTDPRNFDPAYRIARGGDDVLGRGNVTDDLARLLQRAHAGDDNVRLIGQTTIRGIPVDELRVDYTERSVAIAKGDTVTDPRGLPTTPIKLSHLVYVDRDSHLPVQIVDLGPGDVVNAIADYIVAERIARTPDSERLLRMAPHPGAKHLTTGGS